MRLPRNDCLIADVPAIDAAGSRRDCITFRYGSQSIALRPAVPQPTRERQAQRRASRVRGIIRQLCGTGRVKAEVIGEQVLDDGQVLLRYRVEEIGFLRTAADLASMPGHPAVKAGSRHKKNFEAWLAGALSDHGVNEPQILAREIVLLMDGAFSIMLVHRNPDYVEAAGRAAAMLVRARSGSATV